MRYKNELIVVLSVVFLIGSYMFKHNSMTSMRENLNQTKSVVYDVQESVKLKQIWSTKGLVSKLNKIKSLANSPKVWQLKSKKLIAKFDKLDARRLNLLLTKFVKLPIQIQTLKITKSGQNYTLELKCKW